MAAALWACSSAPTPQPDEPSRTRILHREASSVGRVYVVEQDDLRYLRFDDPLGDDQSVADPDDPTAVPMDYVRLALACLAHADRLERVLMIGLGAGSFATAIYRASPKVQIDVVEISPVVARVAAEWFGLPEDPRYRIHLADGRAFLERTDQRWDVIFLDAYTETETPDLMQTRLAFQRVRDHLRPGGMALLNLAVDADVERRAIEAMRASFGDLVCYETPDGENLVAVGCADRECLAADEAAERAGELDASGRWPFSPRDQLSGLVPCPR